MKNSSLAVLALLVMAALATAIMAAGTPTATQAASPQKAAVTGLSATPGASPGEIAVTWNAHPAGAVDYRVKWAPNGENFRRASDTDWNAKPTATGMTIAGLTGGSDYKVKVRARFDSNPRSRWSSVATATASPRRPRRRARRRSRHRNPLRHLRRLRRHRQILRPRRRTTPPTA